MSGTGSAPPQVPRIEQPPPDAAWLARGEPEEVLDPARPIVDPHHHFSEHWGGYFGADLLADLGSGHAVTATVHVQCGHGYDTQAPAHLAPVGETRTALRIAQDVQAQAPGIRLCAGIVGFADFGLGAAVDEVLAAHVAAGQGRLRGIRRSAARDDGLRYGVLAPPPIELYRDATFQRGVSCLAPFGLSFDALCYHPQLDDLVALARAVPQVAIVVNHTGGPLGVGPYVGRREEVFQAWRRGMAALANCDNVHVKLGGLGVAVAGFDLRARQQPATSRQLAELWRPWFETCIECFGARRCMFESNFPVDKSGTSYRTLWNAFKRITAGASADEKDALFAGTASAVYRLGPA